MAIDDDMVVEIDGGKVYFEQPKLNEFAFLKEFEGKNVVEESEILSRRITKIEGLVKKDGSEFTLDHFKNKDMPLLFFRDLVNRWLKQTLGKLNGEAEAKNG